MLKTLFGSLFFLIFICYSTVVEAQEVIPGEYIIQWNSKAAARDFYQNNIQSRVSFFVRNQIVFSAQKVWEHVVVAADQTDYFEKQWKTHPSVDFFQKNRKIQERKTPDDPNFSQQWQYINNGNGGVPDADIDADLAWDITTGGVTATGDTIVVCVIDEGVNLNHPDLASNLWVNHHEIPDNGLDDDDNGYIDDYFGWNIVTDNDDLSSGGSHGTPVCGIVGARGNNTIGVAGVNWNVKIMFVNYGSASEANALAAYAYAYTMRKMYNETNGQKGAFVVVSNASWGVNNLFAEDAPLWCEMYDLLGSVGVLNCGATANENLNVDTDGDMPTSCGSEFLLAVTNLNRSDQKLNGAAYGKKSVDLGAYGHQTYTIARNEYAAFGGTSAATPHVAGTVALMYSVPCNQIAQLSKSNPSAAALLVKDMLLHGTKTNNSLTGITTSGSRLNAHLALQNMEALCQNCAPPAGITLETTDDSIKVRWVNENANSVFAVRIRATESTEWVFYQNYTNGKALHGLDYCKEYELQVGYQCGSAQKFSYSKYFVSGGCCAAPEQFTYTYENGNLNLKWQQETTGDVLHAVSFVDLAGNGRDTMVTQPSLTLQNVDTCSWFSFSVAVSCLQFNNVSPIVENIIVTTPCGSCTHQAYCTFSKKITRDEWIEEVLFGSFRNKSGVNENGYGNFLGGIVPEFYKDSSYTLSVLPGFSESPFTEEYSVYIDYDQNGTFEEVEKVLSRRTSSVNGASGTVVIPETALTGVTRMRVILAFQNHAIPCDDPEFEYGETEDYCIKINDPKACVFSGGLAVDSSGVQQVSVSFNETSGALFYIVIYKKINEETYDTLLVSDNPFLISGLDSCQVYILSVAPDCGPQLPLFSDPVLFNSPCKTSVSDIGNVQSVYIAPNPSANDFKVIHLQKNTGFTFGLTDMYGVYHPVEAEYTENVYRIRWPEGFPSGMYFLKIQEGKQIYLKKVVKL